jgi:hypothetical protein
LLAEADVDLADLADVTDRPVGTGSNFTEA